MDKRKVLVVSEEGFSWFLVASALDRRSLVLQWQRSVVGLADSVAAYGPDLVVIGEVGPSAAAVLAACQTTSALAPTVVLDLPELALDAGAVSAAGGRETLSVAAGTEELRARLLHHLGLASAREPRLRIARPAVLEVAGRTLAGATIDVGPGGAALRMLASLPAGETGRLTIELGAGGGVSSRVEVLRASGDSVVVRFLDMGQADRERLGAMARRGTRDLPSLFDGVPRLVDVLLQSRRALGEEEPAGPMPPEWIRGAVAALSPRERELLGGFDAASLTSHAEEEDDVLLLLAVRVALSYCGMRLQSFDTLAPAVQERLSEAIRANLQTAEKVFKEAAVRGAVRRAENPSGPDAVAAAQRGLLEVALPVRDRFNALAGDAPVAAFPALQVPEDYFRATHGPSVRYDPAAFRTRDRAPRRGEFTAVSIDAAAPPPPAVRRALRNPYVSGTLGLLAAVILVVLSWRGGSMGPVPERLSPEQLAHFGGLVSSGVIQGDEPAMLLAVVDGAQWDALGPEGRRAALAGVRERLDSFSVSRATLLDHKGRMVAVVDPDFSRVTAPRERGGPLPHSGSKTAQ
ncbi:PilZ domain-containing protein [Myxococcota bacterium]|nr:PilZ domain-containing protein [Myxococcota bacterium]